ncbi:MAG: hypothetical protein WD607_03805, partial [Candidatus Paceibacterota bacterium]
MNYKIYIKHLIIGVFFALQLSFPLQSQSIQYQSEPNIIFIMADDMGYGDLGSYGQELMQTPNI